MAEVLVQSAAFRFVIFALVAATVIGGTALIWWTMRLGAASITSGGAGAAPGAGGLQPSRTAGLGPASYALIELPASGRTIEVDRSPCRIGRHSSSDVVIDDVRVSRHHARLEREPDGRVVLTNETADRSEPNPVLVDGNYREVATLGPVSRVSIGGVELVIHLAERS